jgi:hypothetical protein
MVIEFACPNGHMLKAPEERAGKTGKCPKCGIAFVVPDAEEPIEDFGAPEEPPPAEEAPVEPSTGSGKSAGAAATASPPEPAAETPAEPPAKPAREETIAFLCPNGHKLTSPVRLQGKAGKCPHCGEKFIVPSMDDAEDEPEEFGVEDETLAFGDDGGFGDEGGFGPAEDFDDEIPEEAVEEEELGAPHPMRLLFERLWREHEHGGKIRLHLSEGGPLDADFYARKYSRGGFGVVASRDEKGNYRIVAMNWDSVRRIEVDELVNLPDGVFE